MSFFPLWLPAVQNNNNIGSVEKKTLVIYLNDSLSSFPYLTCNNKSIHRRLKMFQCFAATNRFLDCKKGVAKASHWWCNQLVHVMLYNQNWVYIKTAYAEWMTHAQLCCGVCGVLTPGKLLPSPRGHSRSFTKTPAVWLVEFSCATVTKS